MTPQDILERYQEVPTIIRGRAARGAKFMDGRRPGWHSTIDLARLNMSSSTSCIVGQSEGHYEKGIETLEIAPLRRFTERSKVVTHGFIFYGSTDYEGWYYLTSAWLYEISKRLNGQEL